MAESDPDGTDPGTGSTGHGAALVRRWWYEVWGEGRLDLIPTLCTEPFVRHSQAGTATRTHAELADDMEQYRRALADCDPVFESQYAQDDRVFSRIRTTGVSLETGELTTVQWLQEHRVDGARLAETWVLYAVAPGWTPGGSPPRSYPSSAVG